MKRIALVLTTVIAFGLISGCAALQQQQTKKPENQQPAATNETKITQGTTQQATTQGKLLNGPLGTIKKDAQKK